MFIYNYDLKDYIKKDDGTFTWSNSLRIYR